MSRKIVDYEPGPAAYVITYYGYGMTPMCKRIEGREEAYAEFERMTKDPHTGVSSMELCQTVARTKYVF